MSDLKTLNEIIKATSDYGYPEVCNLSEEECRKHKLKIEQDKHNYWKQHKLGTTNFHEHKHKDFNKEYHAVQNQYQQLGLKKDKLYKR